MTTRLIDIEAMDPLNHRKCDLGHDEQIEHEDRSQDYPNGGMK